MNKCNLSPARRVLAWLLIPVTALSLSCGKDDGSADARGAPPIIKTKSGAEMVHLAGGWFEMGSASGRPDEKPAHRVWVDPFLIDRYEVTQDQFRRLSMPDPSHFKAPDNPAEQVTYADAIEFCNERSRAEGLAPCYVLNEADSTWTCDYDAEGYRLATEAQWEYACRAGTKTERFFGDSRAGQLSRHAWFADNSSRKTHPVGRKTPNPWGLYDMYGNVAEWCNDRYSDGYYKTSPDRNPRGPVEAKLAVVRGGGYNSSAKQCRSAWRGAENPRFHDACFARDSIGFRCVRKAPPD